MSTRRQWSVAYALQARADFASYQRMATEQFPRCHVLLFLQMACEKLCKAHLCAAGSDPADLQSSHASVAQNLPVVAREQFIRTYGRSLKGKEYLITALRHFGREIELLSPAVDNNGMRLDNCEYPWEDSQGGLIVPINYHFSNLDFARQQTWVLTLIDPRVANAS